MQHVHAVDRHLSGVGLLDAGHDLDQRRLAGAVLAEQRVDLARVQASARRPRAPGSSRTACSLRGSPGSAGVGDTAAGSPAVAAAVDREPAGRPVHGHPLELVRRSGDVRPECRRRSNACGGGCATRIRTTPASTIARPRRPTGGAARRRQDSTAKEEQWRRGDERLHDDRAARLGAEDQRNEIERDHDGPAEEPRDIAARRRREAGTARGTPRPRARFARRRSRRGRRPASPSGGHHGQESRPDGRPNDAPQAAPPADAAEGIGEGIQDAHDDDHRGHGMEGLDHLREHERCGERGRDGAHARSPSSWPRPSRDRAGPRRRSRCRP